MLMQAGTATGRALGTIAGANLAAFTAELGGKVSQQASYDRITSQSMFSGTDHSL